MLQMRYPENHRRGIGFHALHPPRPRGPLVQCLNTPTHLGCRQPSVQSHADCQNPLELSMLGSASASPPLSPHVTLKCQMRSSAFDHLPSNSYIRSDFG